MGTLIPRSSPSELIQYNSNFWQPLTPVFYRKNAPWGLGRISSRTKLNNQNTTALTYSYDYAASAGANSDVYIIGG